MKIPSLVFFFLILFSAHEVLALSCKQYSLEEAFNKSDAVFVGRAKTVETLSAAPPKDMGLLGYLSHKVIFDIERSWKGVKQNHLAIYVRSFPAYWENIFKKDHIYLIFASKNNETSKTEFPVCGTFRLLEPGYDFIEVLNNLVKGKD